MSICPSASRVSTTSKVPPLWWTVLSPEGQPLSLFEATSSSFLQDMIEIQPSSIEFQKWEAQRRVKQTFKLTLRRSKAGKCPVVLTGPLTDRFTLDGPAELASPTMPMLYLDATVEYTVTFMHPPKGDAQTAWSNFQDVIAVHTRETRIDIPLRAFKYGADTAERNSLFPSRLPTIKAPTKRIFQFIVSSDEEDPATKTFSLTPRASSTTRLEPLPNQASHDNQRSCVETVQVNNKYDARAVIRQLRAKKSTKHAKARSSPLEPRRTSSPVIEDLSSFNTLITHVKEEYEDPEAKERQFYSNLIKSRSKPSPREARLVQTTEEALAIAEKPVIPPKVIQTNDRYGVDSSDEDKLQISPIIDNRSSSSSDEEDGPVVPVAPVLHSATELDFYKSLVSPSPARPAPPKAASPPIQSQVPVRKPRPKRKLIVRKSPSKVKVPIVDSESESSDDDNLTLPEDFDNGLSLSEDEG